MPELEIYYPSVVIKAFDSRGLGCFKYVGICIIPSINIFLEQLITEDDYEEQIYGTRKILKPVKPFVEKPETIRKSLFDFKIQRFLKFTHVLMAKTSKSSNMKWKSV